ncbi:hypothetical protein AP75_13845 [Kaistella haifensis DSM 19056]|jgi:hypothetical protein|uniref:Uncharacterized protein n=1 Tax=Kaistella haifensis DSM 19056 TaxID=1450526 RepID=A0A246B6F4_9FLAO|nr:hypothetical protein AP75_13845 [Kaistella haifensis DSM 19056]
MKINKYLTTIAIILIIMGIFSYDLTDYSFDYNKKSWLKIIVGIILLLIYFYRVKFLKINEKF